MFLLEIGQAFSQPLYVFRINNVHEIRSFLKCAFLNSKKRWKNDPRPIFSRFKKRRKNRQWHVFEITSVHKKRAVAGFRFKNQHPSKTLPSSHIRFL